MVENVRRLEDPLGDSLCWNVQVILYERQVEPHAVVRAQRGCRVKVRFQGSYQRAPVGVGRCRLKMTVLLSLL